MTAMDSKRFIFVIIAFGAIFLVDCNNVHKRKINASEHDRNGKSSSKNISAAISRQDIETAINVAEQLIEKLATFERNIHDSGQQIEKFSPFFGQMVDFLPTVEAINNTKNAFVAIKTTQQLAIKFCYRYPKYRECVDQLSNLKLGNTTLGKICSNIYQNIECDDEMKYRSSDESCNNLNNPAWGSSNTAYRRLVKPDYDDGLYALRNSSSDGKGLPSPRIISTMLTNSNRNIDQIKTQAMAIWGLFIGHDMTHTPASNMVNIRTPITCCTSDGMPLKPRRNHISCAPVHIPQSDVFYNKFFQSCMNYVRSLPAMRTDCTIGPTEQMNQASHFLDGSVIYGSNKWKSRTLRAMTGGRLSTTTQEDGDEYPPTLDEEAPCHSTECVHAGDHRVNSHPQLTILHTLFVREHNRIANELSETNKHWHDERIYQEARRIVIAEIQHITYTYWLPHVLGRNYVKNLGLDLATNVGYSETYDEKVDPSISNSFATAGLPFINSMIDGNIELYIEDRNITDVNQLKDHFVKSSQVNQTNYFDNIIRGLATQNSEKVDLTFTEALTHYWYTPSGDFGMDLFSLDIQRGRDHGIPSYIRYRKHCNLSEINSFRDLPGVVQPNLINKLESVYRKVENIDLLVGLMSEIPANDAMVGPTLQCIIGEQFIRTKNGDRFFYENENQPSPFSEAQLEEIRKINLARIFCDNSNNVTRMQNDVFTVPNDDENQLSDCQGTSIPVINLSFWEE